jgi:hypothetical protein
VVFSLGLFWGKEKKMNVIHFLIYGPFAPMFGILFILLLIISVATKKHTVAAGISFIASYVLFSYAWVGVEGSLKLVLIWVSVMLVGLAQQLGMPTGIFSQTSSRTPVEPSVPERREQQHLGGPPGGAE